MVQAISNDVQGIHFPLVAVKLSLNFYIKEMVRNRNAENILQKYRFFIHSSQIPREAFFSKSKLKKIRRPCT